MLSLKGKKVLVTGAGGFIGSHLTEKLLRAKAEVTAFLRYTSSGNMGQLRFLPLRLRKNIHLIYGDIRNQEDCLRAMEGVQYVFHLAAQIAIPYSYIAPGDFLMVNAIGTVNMLQTARRLKIKKYVQVSTSEVYGTAQYVPIDENHPKVAQSPYAASKIAADGVAESFYRSFDFPVVTVRPFNTYGPRQSARAVIPAIILQGLKGRIVNLGNTETRRDLNYVDDIANGMMLGCFNKNTVGMTLNLASGKDYSIAEIVGFTGDILGKKLLVKRDKRRVRPKSSEVDRLVGDSGLAEKVMQYLPANDMLSGLEKTIRFFEENIDLYDREDYQI